MEVASAGLFEEFDDSASARGKRVLPGALRVRPAEVSDSDAVGRIAAERESGIASEHEAGFRRELEIGRTEGTFMIFVAELDGQVIGFGRTRYLDEEHGAVVGESPAGWYLNGVVVDPRFRRRGVGSRVTAERLTWISERSRFAYYFANARNRVSIALHERFGFTEVARGPEFCGVSFAGGEGILFEVDLSQSAWMNDRVHR